MRRRARRDMVEDDVGVMAASLRDPERFEVIFDRHARAIGRYLARRLGQQAADDLVGETFLAAFRRRGSFDATRGDVLPWLYGIATHVVAQHGRAEARLSAVRQAAAPAPDERCHADRVVAAVSAGAVRDRLLGALAGLSAGDRDVLLLVAQEELTYEQVAQALGVPIGTVRSRLHRARVSVRAALGGVNPTMIDEEVFTRG